MRSLCPAIPTLALATALLAQGGDPGPAVFAFVESGPAGCAAANASYAPSFDPAWFPGCWLPPQNCPAFEAVADGGNLLRLPFRDVPPGAPCLLLVSPPGTPTLIPPCHHAGHDVLAFAVANANGTLVLTLPVPFVTGPWVGAVPLGIAQLVALDVASPISPPTLATSRALLVEARF